MRWLLIGVVVVLSGIVAFWLSETRRHMVAAARQLPVNFEHIDHQSTNCLVCHHNFVDDTGNSLCFDCHEQSPQVGHLMQAQFHEFCRGCHMEQEALGEAHGPARRCRECHVENQSPWGRPGDSGGIDSSNAARISAASEP